MNFLNHICTLWAAVQGVCKNHTHKKPPLTLHLQCSSHTRSDEFSQLPAVVHDAACVHGKRWMCLCVSPALTHLLFCLHSTLRCPSTPTWTVQRTVHSSEDKSGTVFCLCAHFTAYFLWLSVWTVWHSNPICTFCYVLKRQWRVTRDCTGGERCNSSAWVGFQCRSSTATVHDSCWASQAAFCSYWTNDKILLPFSCSLTLSLPSLTEGQFSTGVTWPNSLWYQSLCVYAGNIIMKIAP